MYRHTPSSMPTDPRGGKTTAAGSLFPQTFERLRRSGKRNAAVVGNNRVGNLCFIHDDMNPDLGKE